MMQSPVIHWLRRDLRVEDNPALSAAVESGCPVVAVYVLDDDTPGRWAMGAAARWWLHHSLAALADDLEARGGRLLLRRGRAVDEIAALAAETGARTVFCTRRYEPFAQAEERALAERLSAGSVGLRRFGGNLLFEPDAVATKTGAPYKVFTPFYRACLDRGAPNRPIPAPTAIRGPDVVPDGLDLDALSLRPRGPDWSGGLARRWTPGTAGARGRLDRFIDTAMAGYADRRDLPGVDGTSGLSPHLAFGEISPRACWTQATLATALGGVGGGAGSDAGCQAFLRELVWREFSHHLLYHCPELPDTPFRPSFAEFPWREDAAALRAWQRGQTGYPIVDAGMRELWSTGWMHNRVRMVVASFLVKHLLVPWQAGAAWFWDTLVDADLANNSASWQWVAGCGADAAPYFRIFNPMTQGRKFDPEGAFVRRWVPELARLPDAHLHEPWSAPQLVLDKAGVMLGQSYPAPIVEHGRARVRALEAYQEIKGEAA